MTSRDFVYFLQGFFEISESTTISEKQAQVIKNHLAMVFIHEIDPSMGDDKQQAKLDEVHTSVLKDVVKAHAKEDKKHVFPSTTGKSTLYRC